jgi:hypothetical protein
VYWPRRTNIIEKHFAAAVAHEEVYRRLAEAAIRREGLSVTPISMYSQNKFTLSLCQDLLPLCPIPFKRNI